MPTETFKDKRLVRYPHEGPIAGVCAGVAEYLGIDPTVVRIGAVILAMFGPGIPLYLLAWVIVPAAGQRPIAAGRAAPGSGWDRASQAIGFALMIVAISILWGSWWSPAPRWFLPIGLVALGIWLLFRRDRDDDPTLPGPAGDPSPWRAPAAPTSTIPAPPAPGAGTGEGADTGTTTNDDGEATAVHDTTTHDTDTDTLTDGEHVDGEDATATTVRPPWEAGDGGPPDEPPTLVDEASSPTPPPAARRHRRLLGSMVFGALLVWGGIAWLAGVDLEDGLAVGLCIVGVGFVIGAFVGGSWGLVVPAVLLGCALVAASVVDIPLDGGIGDKTWTVEDVDDLEETYAVGIGKGSLDLSALDVPDGTELDIEATVGIGELIVHVPDDVQLEIDSQVGAGELDVLGRSDEGLNIDTNRSIEGDADRGAINLTLHVGLGHLQVDERFERSRVLVPR